MDQLVGILILVGVGFVALLAIGLIISRLYRRSSKEVSFVRTGFGGQRVVMNGGTLVLPVLHDIIPVNMNTLRLEVRRSNEQALITKDLAGEGKTYRRLPYWPAAGSQSRWP